MKYYYFVIPSLIVLINVPNVVGEDTLKIDTILDHDFDTHYNFPKQTQLDLTGNHDMCPSNDCKMIYDKSVEEFIGTGITLNAEPNKMTVNGWFKLKGAEDKWIIGLLFKCEPIDIEKNAKLGTTKYVCNGGSGSFLPEDESLGAYNYDFSASFELPSRHFILNGTNTATTGG